MKAMIAMIIDHERKESEFLIDWRIKCWWTSRA